MEMRHTHKIIKLSLFFLVLFSRISDAQSNISNARSGNPGKY